MCVYNGRCYLQEAVDSILSQTFAEFECIVVDDGSTDDSYDILRSYRDSRLKLIRKKHTGLTHSLNVGLAEASGTWIARMDTDDIAEPNRLASQLERVQSNPQLVLVGSNCRLIDAEGRMLWQGRYPEGHEAIVRHLERGGNPFPHGSALFRLEAAREVGGYNQRFRRSQDIDLWLRLAEKGHIACIQEPLIQLRTHPQSISTKERGTLQAVYGTAAVVCHLRRRMGLHDPSAGPKPEWEEFYHAVRDALERSGVLAAVGARRSLREHLQSQRRNGRIVTWFGLARMLSVNPGLVRGLVVPLLHRRAIQRLFKRQGS